MGTKHFRTKRVNGGNVRTRHFGELFFQQITPFGCGRVAVDFFNQLFTKLFLHLRRGFLGKGHGKDFPYPRAVFDKTDNFFNHNGGFTAACGSGNNGSALRLYRA